jgi:hypothetical protein
VCAACSRVKSRCASTQIFKKAYIDLAPVSNAEIARTLAHVLRLELPQNRPQVGHVIADALVEGPDVTAFLSGIKESEATASGMKTRSAIKR